MGTKTMKKGEKLSHSWDPNLLYMLSVQDPVSPTMSLMKRVYRKARGRRARVFREDFCGTALQAYEWVREHRSHRAIGIDLDPAPLNWAREHFAPQLSEDQNSRLQLLEQDVMEDAGEPADICCAFNFSYMIFMTRDALRGYFRHARQSIADDGVLFLDLFGGGEAMSEHEESTEVEMEADDCDSPLLGHLLDVRSANFEYVWEQRAFNPVNHHIHCRISFEFPDGSRIKNAYSYSWRLWTVPELRELLSEAGFSSTQVHCELHDEDGDFLGYEQTESMDDDPCWIAYVAAFA